MASLVIGIDGGASSTTALLADAATGRVLGRGAGGPSNIQAVGEDAALRELNDPSDVQPTAKHASVTVSPARSSDWARSMRRVIRYEYGVSP